MDNNLVDIFKKYNAFLEGHFLLSSGLHSDKYLQCALVLQYPHLAEKVAMRLFEKIKEKSDIWEKVSVVVSPALGGIVIGQEVARVIKTMTTKDVRAIFTERDTTGNMVLRRGFSVSENDNVLIVEDVVTTGKSTKEVIGVISATRAKILATSSIFYRGKEDGKFEYPFFYISKIDVNNYKPEECPLCKKNIPIVKPGSRK